MRCCLALNLLALRALFTIAFMHRKTTLANGLRVITQDLPGTNSVTALVLVKAGSRWEDARINGISHFLEHMFFKGAKIYKNAKAVSAAIDGVGGEFNAFTGKEYAGYYVKLAATKLPLALEVLSDMLLHARFDQEEIEKERGVIMEEFNMYQDTPMYQVAWDFERAIFGDQPIGWDEVGTKEVIKTLNREDFVEYKEALYGPENMVLCLAGSVDHDKTLPLIEELFNMDKKPAAREMLPFEEGLESAKRVYITNKRTEQAHLLCGVRGLPAEHKDHYGLVVMAAILGGNMSSRMFQTVREEKGLAYYISTKTENYLDVGTFYTRAGVNVERIDEAVKAILVEYDKLRFVEVTTEELSRAKEFLKGKLTLSLEDSEHVASFLAQHELLYGKLRSYNDIAKGIDKVTAADVKRLATEIFKPEALHLAVIGPYDDEARFEKLLKF